MVKLDVVRDRTQAEQVRGWYLTVPTSQVQTLPAGTYYHFQIIGASVWTEDREDLGKVKEIFNTGSNDVYVVARENGSELLIPALEDVVTEVNLREKTITVKLPEGLR